MASFIPPTETVTVDGVEYTLLYGCVRTFNYYKLGAVYPQPLASDLDGAEKYFQTAPLNLVAVAEEEGIRRYYLIKIPDEPVRYLHRQSCPEKQVRYLVFQVYVEVTEVIAIPLKRKLLQLLLA